MHRLTIAPMAVLPIFFATTAANADWSYHVITPAGQPIAAAYGLAPGAGVAVGLQGSFVSPRATVWTSLDPASAVNVNPVGASSSSLVRTTGSEHVGSATIGGIQHAGIWHGTSSSFTSLDPGGYTRTLALDTDGVHQVGQGQTTAGQNRALLWAGSAGSLVVLNPPNSVGAFAYAMAAGRQVGSARFAPTYTEDFAGFWSGTAASWTLLGAPTGFFDSQCTAISPDGQTQAGWALGATGVNWAAMWHSTPGSFVSLHPAGFLGSAVEATDGAYETGWVIPGFGVGFRAAIWQGSVASFFNLSTILPADYTISEADGVYSTATDVWVVGDAYKPATNTWDAIVWHETIPTPGAATLLALAAAGATRRRRGSR